MPQYKPLLKDQIFAFQPPESDAEEDLADSGEQVGTVSDLVVMNHARIDPFRHIYDPYGDQTKEDAYLRTSSPPSFDSGHFSSYSLDATLHPHEYPYPTHSNSGKLTPDLSSPGMSFRPFSSSTSVMFDPTEPGVCIDIDTLDFRWTPFLRKEKFQNGYCASREEYATPDSSPVQDLSRLTPTEYQPILESQPSPEMLALSPAFELGDPSTPPQDDPNIRYMENNPLETPEKRRFIPSLSPPLFLNSVMLPFDWKQVANSLYSLLSRNLHLCGKLIHRIQTIASSLGLMMRICKYNSIRTNKRLPPNISICIRAYSHAFLAERLCEDMTFEGIEFI